MSILGNVKGLAVNPADVSVVGSQLVGKKPGFLLRSVRKLFGARPKCRCVNHNLPLQKARFVVIDIETTGFYPEAGDEIISLGAVVIENGEIRRDQVFHQLVNPGRSIPAVVTELTGISDEMVADQPSIQEILPDFLEFIGDAILVGHVVDFDLHFINKELEEHFGFTLPHVVLDTRVLAGGLLPSAGDRSLDNLCRLYNIPAEGRHTALGDALITARLFQIILNNLYIRGVYNLQDLLQLYRKRNRFSLMQHVAQSMLF
ncbi:3'-5' exonuclease [Calderihabitans maritimus]|uniref:DNA polymerase III subunit epsilon n=1 Tax=Calderihabitans maritimus TaxID=1246530 RepID=A0A1Z5HSD8_9FIRM|nr:exonuclease domain-containing protein [Calderihabitans maritimus]GAW92434.1 DNA polymerase III subunit epsilon [Calderihabitans maritimus]